MKGIKKFPVDSLQLTAKSSYSNLIVEFQRFFKIKKDYLLKTELPLVHFVTSG